MLTLQQIMSEADVLVPNAYTSADKVSWLNSINQDFFNVVKIPLIFRFSTVSNQSDYQLPTDARAKNIDLVQTKYTMYLSLVDEIVVSPTQSYWTFDDATKKITLTPAPPLDGWPGVVRYHRIATTNFVSNNLGAQPDAPPEYHWIYTIGLCARIAKAQDDLAKATNYESDYRNALNTAAANYAKDVGR